MLLISLPLSHGGVRASWWRTLPPVRAPVLAAGRLRGAVGGRRGDRRACPSPRAMPLAGLAGLVNARAWYGLAGAVARRADPRAGRLAGQAGWPGCRWPRWPPCWHVAAVAG